MTSQLRRPPRDEEEAAAFKDMGQVITLARERRRLDRDELASKCEMTRAELEGIESGAIDELWGRLRLVAKALGMPLPVLIREAEEFAGGSGGGQGRQGTREAESESTVPSSAAEGEEQA